MIQKSTNRYLLVIQILSNAHCDLVSRPAMCALVMQDMRLNVISNAGQCDADDVLGISVDDSGGDVSDATEGEGRDEIGPLPSARTVDQQLREDEAFLCPTVNP